MLAGAAALGLVLASLLASSAVQRPAVAAASGLPPAAESSPAAPINAAANPPWVADLDSAPASTAREREIDNLATIVARRYRVSRDATRTLVGAAYRAGNRSGLDPVLILAVIAVESRFNPIAQSDGGAIGLMQVIPHYHADKFGSGAGSVLDPETNIEVGVSVLKDYIKRGGTEIAGLQLYNGALDDAGNSYATRVLAEKQRLQDALRREHPRDRV